MKLLLDTHVMLWAMTDDLRLSVEARDLMQAADAVYVSTASLWEIAIKAGLGKIEVEVAELTRQLHLAGFQELPVTWQHTLKVSSLPSHHQDPFDRLLIAQALSEPLRLLTADRQLPAYSSDLVTLV
ncbi:MAG: type II toxin-antitoxin system VapC family toxin [Thiomonas sp.]|nr:type II toxin-antitoxin system VapC family toxin [Thiomonas sp.]